MRRRGGFRSLFGGRSDFDRQCLELKIPTFLNLCFRWFTGPDAGIYEQGWVEIPTTRVPVQPQLVGVAQKEDENQFGGPVFRNGFLGVGFLPRKSLFWTPGSRSPLGYAFCGGNCLLKSRGVRQFLSAQAGITTAHRDFQLGHEPNDASGGTWKYRKTRPITEAQGVLLCTLVKIPKRVSTWYEL